MCVLRYVEQLGALESGEGDAYISTARAHPSPPPPSTPPPPPLHPLHRLHPSLPPSCRPGAPRDVQGRRGVGPGEHEQVQGRHNREALLGGAVQPHLRVLEGHRNVQQLHAGILLYVGGALSCVFPVNAVPFLS